MVACMLMICCVFYMTGTASAETARAEETKNGYDYCYTMTTIVLSEKRFPIVESQAKHTKGYTTTIGISTSKSRTWTSSSSITAGFPELFAALSVQLTVSDSYTQTVAASVSYQIDASHETGFYRITMACPHYKVTNTVEMKSNGTTVSRSVRTIEYAPGTVGSYYFLDKYA